MCFFFKLSFIFKPNSAKLALTQTFQKEKKKKKKLTEFVETVKHENVSLEALVMEFLKERTLPNASLLVSLMPRKPMASSILKCPTP